MSVTTGTFPGVRIVDMPDLGAVTDASSLVGEHAGSGRFSAIALKTYITPPVPQPAGDGVTDDTAILQSWIDANAHGSLAITRPGTYMVSGLVLDQPIALTLGAGVTLKLLPGANAKLLGIGSGNVSVRGPGTLDANGQSGTGAPEPIFAQSVNNLTFCGLTILNSTGYGIHVVDCSQVTICDNVVARCASYSIAAYTIAVSTQDFTITGNRIDRTDTAYDPTGAGHCIAALNNNLSGLTMNRGVIAYNLCNGKNNPSAQGCGITTFATSATLQPFYGWTITGNTVSGGYFGLSVGQGYGFSVTGNTIFNHKAYAIELPSAQDCACAGNSIAGGPASTHGIVVDAVGSAVPSNSIAITGNTIRGCPTACIYTSQFCNRIAITGNSMEQATGHGIQANGGSEVTIGGNSVSGLGTAAGVGIDLTGNTDAVVYGNNLTGWGVGNAIGNTGANAKVDAIYSSDNWTPGAIAAGQSLSYVSVLADVAIGDVAQVSFDPVLTAGILSFAAAGGGGVLVQIFNATGASTSVPAEALKIAVRKI